MQSAAPESAFELVFTPDTADIDALGHVNNTVYLRWAQDIATDHWRLLAPKADVDRFVWVVTRHEIDYRTSILPGERVKAQTWVSDTPKGATWDRFVVFRREDDAKPAAVCKSTWAILDAVRRRPVRPPQAIVDAFKQVAGPPP